MFQSIVFRTSSHNSTTLVAFLWCMHQCSVLSVSTPYLVWAGLTLATEKLDNTQHICIFAWELRRGESVSEDINSLFTKQFICSSQTPNKQQTNACLAVFTGLLCTSNELYQFVGNVHSHDKPSIGVSIANRPRPPTHRRLCLGDLLRNLQRPRCWQTPKQTDSWGGEKNKLNAPSITTDDMH